MKAKRQAKILDIIRNESVTTQEDLIAHLQRDGFAVTQATVSRDIKELRLVKAQNAKGEYCYTAARSEEKTISTKFYSLFADAVQKVDYAGNIVVVRCLAGMAQAVCAAMDSYEWAGVVGSLAGEDTVICIVKDEPAAIDLVAKLQKLTRR